MARKILHITEHFLTPFSGWRRVGNTVVNLFLANMKTGSNRHLVRELDPMGRRDIFETQEVGWAPELLGAHMNRSFEVQLPPVTFPARHILF